MNTVFNTTQATGNKQIFVFDLDFTLWDAGGTWCDATNPPYEWKNGRLLDQSGAWIRLYSDVTEILKELNVLGKFVVAASRTFEPMWARDLLHLFDIDRYFHLKEIYPCSKVAHFKRIRTFFNLPYSEMVFFDDEYRNIMEVGELGVQSFFVRDGISRSHVQQFLENSCKEF